VTGLVDDYHTLPVGFMEGPRRYANGHGVGSLHEQVHALTHLCDRVFLHHDVPRARSRSVKRSATVSNPGKRTSRFSDLSHLFTFFSAAMTVV
jgi:hypothetical protein